MRVVIVIVFALLTALPAKALETDQFTVPSKPLADSGPSLDAKAAKALREVVAAANATRARELRESAASPSRSWRKVHRERAYAAVSQQALAEAFYKSFVGGGVPVCKIEDWVLDDRGPCYRKLQPMQVGDSVYGSNPFQRPFLLLEMSPTIRLHDQYVGVDKIGHFFQQGHEYFDRYFEARREGKSEDAATAAAVEGGVDQEHGFYGEAIIGIYSNADLAANFAGLLFYRNLTEPVTVGDVTLPPMVEWDGDKLKVADRASADLLKPFITEHWNEAMNPCHYVGYWRPFVRDRIAGRVDAWMAFNHSSPAQEAERLERVQTFFGQNYGHSGWREVVTLINAKGNEAVASR